MEITITNGIAEIRVEDLQKLQNYVKVQMDKTIAKKVPFQQAILKIAEKAIAEAGGDSLKAAEAVIDNLQTQVLVGKFVHADLTKVHGKVAFGAIGSDDEIVDPSTDEYRKLVKEDLEARRQSAGNI